jgi:hypothetical protein
VIGTGSRTVVCQELADPERVVAGGSMFWDGVC